MLSSHICVNLRYGGNKTMKLIITDIKDFNTSLRLSIKGDYQVIMPLHRLFRLLGQDAGNMRHS